MGRRLHKIGSEVDTLASRTESAQTNIEKLKHQQTRSVNGWETCVDRVQYARQSLDQLIRKQDDFSVGCDKVPDFPDLSRRFFESRALRHQSLNLKGIVRTNEIPRAEGPFLTCISFLKILGRKLDLISTNGRGFCNCNPL